MKKITIFISLLYFVALRCPAQTIGNARLTAYKDTVSTNFFRRTRGLVAMDGALSVQLPGRKVFWIFGDSNIDQYDPVTKTIPCGLQVRSSGLLQPENNWDWRKTATILGDKGSDLFRINTAKSYFTWPGTGFQLGDTTYVYCINLKQIGSNISPAGKNKWAKLCLPAMKVVGYTDINDGNAVNAKISFGVFGFVRNNDGYVYAYGLKSFGFALDKVIVARFPQNKPRAAWVYWNGTTWGAAANAAPAGTLPAAGYSYNICKVHDKFVMTSTGFSLACDMSTAIYAAASTNPAGPFLNNKLIYNIEDRKQGHSPMLYQAVAHPQYINKKDELLLTYCINGYENANAKSSCIPHCINGRQDPDDYRPRAVRVPLKLIDPGFK